MSIFDAILLGFVQGLTEFFPVSSSGHLAITQHWLKGFEQPGLFFDVLLHVGTMLAVMVFFWRDVVKLTLAPFRDDKEYRHLLKLIIIGSVPTAIIGLLFKDFFEGLFGQVIVVGAMLIVTGTILFICEKFNRGDRRMNEVRPIDAVITGIAQGMAIVPGISRSGSTIAAMLLRGVEGETAARFSFLLALPAVLGAALLTAKDLDSIPTGGWTPYLIGTAVSFVTGLVAIRFLMAVIRRRRLLWFSCYCWAVGILVILLAIY